jgi:type I restriction enzyme S subunit
VTRPLYPHPNDWIATTLEPDPEGGVIVEAASGSTPPTEDDSCWGGTFPWLTPKEVTDASYGRTVAITERTLTSNGLKKAGGLCETGSVLLTKRAPVGIPVINSIPLAINQGFLGFRCGKKLDARFLYYWFRANGPYLDAVANGSTYPELYVGDLFEFEVAVPLLVEQEQIISILSTLDDKIELNRRMNETLDAIAQAVFKSWFVDFDPVRTKASGQKPAGMNDATAKLFPDNLKASPLGEIPDGWHVTTWRELVTLEYGKSLSGYDNDKREYPVYGTNGKIGTHTKFLCEHPGIIVGRKGAYRGVHFCNSPFFVIDTAFYVEPKAPIEMRWAYYELLRHDINNMDSGSAIPSTSREDFYSLPVLEPPCPVQQRFVQLLNCCWTRQVQNEKESSALITLRDALLPKLLSGELRVMNAVGKS